MEINAETILLLAKVLMGSILLVYLLVCGIGMYYLVRFLLNRKGGKNGNSDLYRQRSEHESDGE